MSEHEPTLLPRLTPPAGGLARLYARREQRRPAAPSLWGFAAAASAGACCALLLLALQPVALEAPGLDRLRNVAAAGAAPTLRDGHVVSLPSQQPGVRVYWTASLQAEATPRER